MASKAKRHEADPTGQAANRKRANQDNTTRLNNANRSVLSLIANLEPRKTTRKQVVNESLDFYDYGLDNNDLGALENQVSSIVNEEMQTEQVDPPFDWYYSQYVEQAARGGVIQENAWIAVILAGLTVQVISPRVILSSPRYQSVLLGLTNDNYRLLKGLSEDTSRKVFGVIDRGVKAGLGKAVIKRQVTEAFQTAKSSAKRIVDTGVNDSYNDARMDTIQAYEEAGAPLAVQHISALIPTTRGHHASRHGMAFTLQAQYRWWDQGANKINCHCSARAIVINSDGTVKDTAAQDKVIKRGETWFKDN